MKHQFIKTENTMRFLAALEKLRNRGAAEACLMVVDGVPGLGKTRNLQWYATQNGSTFLRAKEEWRPTWLMRDLLAELGVGVPAHSFEAMFKQAIAALLVRAEEAQREGKEHALVIDEADHISRRVQLLETLRDLSDHLELPVILVGMGRVRDNLKRFPQVASRVAQYVDFKPSQLSDVQKLVNGLCEVSVSEELVAYLAEATGGFTREVKEAIAAIERFGKLNSGRTIGLEDMKGEVLLNDRRTGKPIKVAG